MQTRFDSVVDLSGWRMKVYGIAAGRRPRPMLLSTAKRLALRALPERPDLTGAFGLGFVTVHDADDCCLVLIDWWMRPDELCQRAFAAPPEYPAALAPLATATIGRMSELTIVAHEQQAWRRNVLDRAVPDVDGYLADVLEPHGSSLISV